jgi:hypothetical protein
VIYLQAVVSQSRQGMHDSSSGMRRLAKMIDLCYPEVVQEGDDDDSQERKGVGGLLRRVMGKKKDKKGVNEDRYDLVTPFYEW